MEKMEQVLNDFFDLYAQRFNRSLNGEPIDVESIASSFSACFIEASPIGVNCGQNDLQFRSVIPSGYEFYRKVGITNMDILSKDITILDDLHAMVTIRWNSRYIRKDHVKGQIEFDVIYLLQIMADIPKIFAYITGDEQTALQDHGLI